MVKPRITVEPRADESTWSADDIIAKRLAGAVFGVRTEDIPLKEPGKWQLYIGNSQGNEARHYDLVHRKGWVPFSTSDLADGISAESIGFRVAEDGQTLVRGTRGEEVVYKMPKEAYEAIQFGKAEKNTASMKSPNRAKDEAANAAASAIGDQAGEYIAKHGNITIRDTVTGG